MKHSNAIMTNDSNVRLRAAIHPSHVLRPGGGGCKTIFNFVACLLALFIEHGVRFVVICPTVATKRLWPGAMMRKDFAPRPMSRRRKKVMQSSRGEAPARAALSGQAQTVTWCDCCDLQMVNCMKSRPIICGKKPELCQGRVSAKPHSREVASDFQPSFHPLNKRLLNQPARLRKTRTNKYKSIFYQVCIFWTKTTYPA